ncbi:MAG: hydroxysqualene dehydroxylase HpnE [Burkholderiaceae bacterium]|nr:hydroxysqualene dehydroxylase HpnE [Burkholderiaceae bacterium]
MKVAVVGAGWAGLAAASQCMALGMDVTLYEASHKAGGRARAVSDSRFGDLDNGQHLLIGAYRETLAMIARDVGADHLARVFKRLPLWLQSADGQFRLKKKLGLGHSTLTDAAALWCARGLGLRDKWRITSLLHRLKKDQQQPSDAETSTVSQWLLAQKQTPEACRWLWYPLCLATLNTSPSEACASLFQKVLIDSFTSDQADALDLLIPSCNLSELWPDTIAKRANVRFGQVVREIAPQVTGVAIDGVEFDACVLAVPPTNLERLVRHLDGFEQLAQQSSSFEFRSIATCYVSVGNHQPLPAPLLMFDHQTDTPGHIGQWVFDRQACMLTQPRAQLAFVVSCADHLDKIDDIELGRALVSQLKQALPSYTGSVIDARCFQEKRATFAALPGLHRPGTQTPHKRIMLAGDWTDTGYPAVIEGAVISGIKAADQIAVLAKGLSSGLQ